MDDPFADISQPVPSPPTSKKKPQKKKKFTKAQLLKLRQRNRTAEYAKRREKRAAAKIQKLLEQNPPDPFAVMDYPEDPGDPFAAPAPETPPELPPEPEFSPDVPAKDRKLLKELRELERRSKGIPTDTDRDIDFAYRHMDSQTVTPLDAPTISAWSWLTYAREERKKFLEITQKREDAKAKIAGTVTSQRIEDDKRKQFAILDRIEQQLKLDIKSIIKDLMEKFPEDTLLECRKYEAAWKSFHEKYP